MSKHLKVLREAGLVEVRHDAQRRFYRVRAEPLAEIDEWLAPYRRLWAGDARRARAPPRREGGPMTTPTGRSRRRDDGSYVLRYERQLRHPIEKVWAALTDPAQIEEWWRARRSSSSPRAAARGSSG